MDLNELNRDELLDIISKAKLELKNHKPFRIKEVFRVVSSDAGETEHCYLFATFRKDGKTVTRSLGRKYDRQELNDMAAVDLPDFDKYFPISPSQYEKLDTDGRRNLIKRTLTDSEFFERHGVTRADDMFNRPGYFFGTIEQYEQFDRECDLAREVAYTVPHSRWSWIGVGTLKGLAILDDLERNKYYYKE